jgi:RNA polymerase sigma-70 factor (ECF subfamily)
LRFPPNGRQFDDGRVGMILGAARDERSFERLYKRHVHDVYRYALAVLGEPADAEDVTQTTFLNAYRAYQRGERPRKPQNWLIAITHNVCRQRFRQAQRRPREVAYVDEIGEPEREENGPGAEEIRRALSQLSPNQRAAIVLRELEGRSYAEVAAVLGITTSALEALLFRARRALREQLEEGLTCAQAAESISRQLDERLPPADERALRAHLRRCDECATLARKQRAQRQAVRGLLLTTPVPSSLSSFFGGSAGQTALVAAGGGGGVGSALVVSGVAVKAAAVVAAGALIGGVGYEGVHHDAWHAITGNPARSQPTPARGAGRKGAEPAQRPQRGSAKAVAARGRAQARKAARRDHVVPGVAKRPQAGRSHGHQGQSKPKGTPVRLAPAAGAAKPKPRLDGKRSRPARTLPDRAKAAGRGSTPMP